MCHVLLEDNFAKDDTVNFMKPLKEVKPPIKIQIAVSSVDAVN